jgi:hypothetical protein
MSSGRFDEVVCLRRDRIDPILNADQRERWRRMREEGQRQRCRNGLTCLIRNANACGKHQTPTSKLQRNSKHQISRQEYTEVFEN